MRQKSRDVNRKGLRQGDVLLKPIPASRIAGQPVMPVEDRFILAEGEHSGHNHMVAATPGVVMMSDGISDFLSVTDDDDATLVHEVKDNGEWVQADHNPLRLYAGDHEVIIQRRVMPGSEHYVIPSVD